MKFDLKSYLKNAFAKGTTINDYNLKALVIVGSLGHPVFAALHIYLFNMPWDSMILKTSAGLVCLSLATRNYWPKKLKPLFPLYWHFMLIYNLSFLITLTSLNNHFIKTWSMWEVIMLYILIMFVPHWLIFLIDLMIGVVGALVIHSLFFGGGFVFDPIITSYNSGFLEILLYISTFMFAVVSGLIFSYSNAKGLASEERAKIFKSLAGSIAHEIRNPLNVISFIGSQIKGLVLDLDKQDKESSKGDNQNKMDQIDNAKKISELKIKLTDLTSEITDSIDNANNIVNIILSDLSKKEIEPEELVYIKSNEILPNIIKKYGYNGELERSKVKLSISQTHQEPFLIKAIPERLTFIVFNLLKNALYYLSQFPDSVVTVGTEIRTITKELADNNPALLPFVGKEVNAIYVHDTGPGIPSHVIGKLFGDFYTFGKKEGTGLGLSFCKRNMLMFGGDVICESKYSKEENSQEESGWTKFSLLFPKLSEEEIKQTKLEAKRRKILIVDDQEVNLINTKSKIEKGLPNVFCDIARSGKEAIEMVKQKKYQLILMDIQMPEVDGIEATKRIRLSDKEVPIIALTSLNKESFLKLTNYQITQAGFNAYLSKSSKDNLLYRGVSKWIIDLQDELNYLGNKEDYIKALQNKKVILADDQQVNRMMTKKILESAGLSIVEAVDGKELLEIYQKSLDANGKSDFDIIITDINMPPHDGDDAAQEIRKVELSNKINHHNQIPIIALSGDGQKEDIYHFFSCQMTDYFIKGTKPELLIKIIANYLTKEEIKAEAQTLNDESNDHLRKFCNLNQEMVRHLTDEERVVILNLFIKDGDLLMSKIAESKKSDDTNSLLLHLHSLKGSAASIGAEKLFNYTKMLEAKIKDGSKTECWAEDLEVIYLDLKNEIKILAG